jgi:uncharacterized protein YndB with AHSA1/START domain
VRRKQLLSETTLDVGRSVTIKRNYSWPPNKLFDAWTQPESMSKWMSPGVPARTDASVELKVGGNYRLVIRQDSGEVFVAFGEYREIEPPAKLAFTWSWEGGIIEPAETLVTVHFVPTPTGTELTLIHERLSSEQSAASHTQGWTGCLDGLQRFIDR